MTHPALIFGSVIELAIAESRQALTLAFWVTPQNDRSGICCRGIDPVMICDTAIQMRIICLLSATAECEYAIGARILPASLRFAY
jgi:hypothetical protein